MMRVELSPLSVPALLHRNDLLMLCSGTSVDISPRRAIRGPVTLRSTYTSRNARNQDCRGIDLSVAIDGWWELDDVYVFHEMDELPCLEAQDLERMCFQNGRACHQAYFRGATERGYGDY